MFEHFQADQQEKYDLEKEEVDELMELVEEISGLKEMDDIPWAKEDVERLIHGLSLLTFRAGRAYQDKVTDTQYVTVHLPVDRAGKFIEALIAESD